MVYTNCTEFLKPIVRNGKRQLMLGTMLGTKKVLSLQVENDIQGLQRGVNREYTIKLLERGAHKLMWKIGPNATDQKVELLLFAEGEIQVLPKDVSKIENLVASMKNSLQVRYFRVSNFSSIYIRIKNENSADEIILVENGEVFKIPVFAWEPLLNEIQWVSV